MWGLAIWWAWKPVSDEWLWPAGGLLLMPILFWTPHGIYLDKIRILQFFKEYDKELME